MARRGKRPETLFDRLRPYGLGITALVIVTFIGIEMGAFTGLLILYLVVGMLVFL